MNICPSCQVRNLPGETLCTSCATPLNPPAQPELALPWIPLIVLFCIGMAIAVVISQQLADSADESPPAVVDQRQKTCVDASDHDAATELGRRGYVLTLGEPGKLCFIPASP